MTSVEDRTAVDPPDWHATAGKLADLRNRLEQRAPADGRGGRRVVRRGHPAVAHPGQIVNALNLLERKMVTLPPKKHRNVPF